MSAYNRNITLDINHLARTRSIASLPYKIVLGDLIQLFSKKSFCHHGFFAVKRRAVFILWTKWIALLRGWRMGLCGWRHGNSFPMTQSAQSLRQMRSIPRCSKAVFMFLFLITFTIRQQCIIYPQDFSTEPKSACVGHCGGDMLKSA